MNVQHIKLNIIPGGVLPVVHVSQYDHNAGGLVFDIYNGGEIYELPEGSGAEIIGEVRESHPGKVCLRTAAGGTRILTKLSGAQLPRIC